MRAPRPAPALVEPTVIARFMTSYTGAMRSNIVWTPSGGNVPLLCGAVDWPHRLAPTSTPMWSGRRATTNSIRSSTESHP